MAKMEIIVQTIVEGIASSLGVASVTHTIPAGYEHLKVCMTGKSNSMSTNYYDATKVRINGDSNNAYYLNQLYGSAASAGGSIAVTQPEWYTPLMSARAKPFTNAYGAAELVFANSHGTSNYKGMFTKTYNNQYQRSTTEGTVYNLIAYQHHYRDATRDGAITSIEFLPYVGTLWLKGSVFTTYGMKSS